MIRLATPDDRPALVALALAEDAAWSGAPAVSAEEAGEFVDSVELGSSSNARGRVAGYAAGGEGGTMLLLDPADDPGPALETLVGWLGERGHHDIDAYAGDLPRIAWLEANGFAHRRSSFDLRRDIEPPPAPQPGRARSPSRVIGRARTTRPSMRWSTSTPPGARCPDTRNGRWRRGGRCSRRTTTAGWRTATDGGRLGRRSRVRRRARMGRATRRRPLRTRSRSRSCAPAALAGGPPLSRRRLRWPWSAGREQHAIGLYRDVGFEVEREWRVYSRPSS